MSYLKLCQLSNENYIETCERVVVVQKQIDFPLQLHCEIIEFTNQSEFLKRGGALSFISEIVSIESPVPSIRQAVFDQLVIKYPTLVI